MTRIPMMIVYPLTNAIPDLQARSRDPSGRIPHISLAPPRLIMKIQSLVQALVGHPNTSGSSEIFLENGRRTFFLDYNQVINVNINVTKSLYVHIGRISTFPSHHPFIHILTPSQPSTPLSAPFLPFRHFQRFQPGPALTVHLLFLNNSVKKK